MRQSQQRRQQKYQQKIVGPHMQPTPVPNAATQQRYLSRHAAYRRCRVHLWDAVQAGVAISAGVCAPMPPANAVDAVSTQFRCPAMSSSVVHAIPSVIKLLLKSEVFKHTMCTPNVAPYVALPNMLLKVTCQHIQKCALSFANLMIPSSWGVLWYLLLL